jgi:soluble lytic murein transglycosylase-like protein
MSVQKAILPGIVLGIFCLISLVNLLTAGFTSRNIVSLTGSSPAEKQAPAEVVLAAAVVPAPVVAECSVSSSYPESILQWCGLIEQYARRNGLDPNLVSAVMLQESGGQKDAYSKSGAVGLMQVMPRDGKATKFMCVNGPCFADRPSTQELFDPEYNIAYGTWMLSDLINRRGNIRDALKSYGPMDVGYYYADLVMNIMNTHR